MARYKLNDIAPVKQGVVPIEDKYWLLNLDMIESNTGRIIDYLYVAEDEIGASTVTFDTENVLYSKLRPYLNKVVLPDQPGYATSEMLPLRPNTEIITREYLTYFLRSSHFVAYINEKTSGAKMPRANSSDLKAVEIECPTIAEQKRITTLFDDITSVIQLRQQELEKLDELIKARFVEMFGYPFDTSKWNMKELKELSESMLDGSNVNTDHYESEGEVLFLRIQNVWRNEFRLDDSVYISQDINKEKYYDTSLKNGDLLITKIGRYYTKDSSLGRVSIYRGKDDCANYSNNIMCVRLNDNMNSEFVNALLNLDEYQSFIKRTSKGGTDKRALSKSLIGSYPIIMPPKELQIEYVDFVKQVDKSKIVVQEALDKAQLLFDSLMQEYFG